MSNFSFPDTQLSDQITIGSISVDMATLNALLTLVSGHPGIGKNLILIVGFNTGMNSINFPKYRGNSG